MENQITVRALAVYLLGIWILALGVVITVISNLGVGAGAIVPYVFSVVFHTDQGLMTIAVNWLFVLAQIVLLGKHFRLRLFLQLPLAGVYGLCITFWTRVLAFISVHSYWQQLILLLCGIVIAALGLSIYLLVEIVALPPESLLRAIEFRIKYIPFGKMKRCYDLSCVALASITSWFFLQRFAGIGEGTVLSALLTGMLLDTFQRKVGNAIHQFLNSGIIGE